MHAYRPKAKNPGPTPSAPASPVPPVTSMRKERTLAHCWGVNIPSRESSRTAPWNRPLWCRRAENPENSTIKAHIISTLRAAPATERVRAPGGLFGGCSFTGSGTGDRSPESMPRSTDERLTDINSRQPRPGLPKTPMPR